MNIKLQIKLRKVLVIIIAWELVAIAISVYDHFTFISLYSAGPAEHYSFGRSLSENLAAATFAGVFGGYFLVFYIDEKLRQKSYGYSIVAVSLAFVVIVMIITLLMGLAIAPILTSKPLSDPKTQTAYFDYITNTIHAKNVLVWAIVVALTQLLFQISNKFGQGVLTDFIIGKYRNPKYEERIFMFLDLKSSTELAENLGNERYHLLLRDFYADITNSIIYNKGQVYQYVGDEVVISWKLQDGVEDSHCVKCYFDIKEKIHRDRMKYLDKYGLVPEFKAGMHYGNVIAGEIGVIKRDITFSGDILNTASRIQGKCNELRVQLLLSGQLAKLLPQSPKYKLKPLGYIELRGKAAAVELNSLEIA